VHGETGPKPRSNSSMAMLLNGETSSARWEYSAISSLGMSPGRLGVAPHQPPLEKRNGISITLPVFCRYQTFTAAVRVIGVHFVGASRSRRRVSSDMAHDSAKRASRDALDIGRRPRWALGAA
jgi:hypothetical protein